MELTVSSETSAIRTQMPGNCPKRNTLHLEHGESLKTKILLIPHSFDWLAAFQLELLQAVLFIAV